MWGLGVPTVLEPLPENPPACAWLLSSKDLGWDQLHLPSQTYSAPHLTTAPGVNRVRTVVPI